MADNISLPSGAVPPKKETGKVQPKKETVRINLPPKPSAAPTIKLPALPPGGPTGGVPSAAAPAAAAAPAPVSAPRAQAAPIAQRSASAPAPRAALPGEAVLSPMDRMLAVAAAVIGLIAAGSVVFIMLIPS
jgi:hypothetical protein